MKKVIYKFSFMVLAIGLLFSVSQAKAQTTTSLSDIYSTLPNINSCVTGALKQTEKDKVLTEVNFIRTTMGLPPVVYDATFDKQAMDEALVIVANMKDFPWGATFNYHFPQSNWHCYTADAASGGASSNLFYTTSTEPQSIESINSWLNDRGVDVLGHRRWLLDPFVKKIAFGRSDGTPINGTGNISGMTYYYDYNSQQDLSSWNHEYVAFPCGDTPPRLWDDNWSLMSFTIIADKGSRNANTDKVSYWTTAPDGSTINKCVIEVIDDEGNITTIKKGGGAPLDPNEKTRGWNYEGYGIPNCLSWQFFGLKKLHTYTVNINSVRVNGIVKNFSYQFTFRDPSIAKPAKPLLSVPANHATNVNQAV